jgi:hypothetical protein
MFSSTFFLVIFLVFFFFEVNFFIPLGPASLKAFDVFTVSCAAGKVPLGNFLGLLFSVLKSSSYSGSSEYS